MASRGSGGGGARLRYRFADFELDTGRGTLVQGDTEVDIRPKLFALLAHLVRHAGRVVPKGEILAEIWPGVHVSEATLASTLRDLRRLLADPADESRFVQTLWSRGIRFVAPVQALLDGATPAEAGRPAPASASGFVGREDLLASAEEWIGAAHAGRGRAILLAGEAGIGKTRAALEIARRAGARGLAVHVGRCLEEDGAPPYWPWIQVVRSLLRAAPEGLRREDPIAQRALRLLPEERTDAAPTPADGEAARFQLFDAVTQLVLAAARERPCVLLLDDLHRADASSVALLRHLLQEIACAPLLLLGGLRDAEVPPGHPLATLLAELHPSGERIALRPLREAEVALLIERGAGLAPSPELVAAVHERTGGHPLFVEHVMRTLERAGAIDAPDAAARATRALPAQASAVIREGVARLPGDVTAVLECAAVIGRTFDLDVLAAACTAMDPAALHGALDVALAAGLVSESQAPGSLRFAHILGRDALYGALPSRRRAELHAAVGAALERLRAHDLDAHVDELAHHFAQAASNGEAARAFRYARRAGERALAHAAYPEAAARFEGALQALELGGPDASQGEPLRPARERGELLVLLGQALWRAGATGEARQSFLAAFELARTASDPETLARAALGFVGRTDVTPGVNREAVAMLEQALAALPEADSPLRAEVLARLGTELYYDDARGRSDPLTRDAVAMAERLGDAGLLAYALSARHFALVLPEVAPTRRLALLEHLVALAERTNALDALALGLQESVAELLELGDAARLDTALRRHRGVVETLRQPFFRWVHAFLSQMRALLAGSLDEADRLAHEALALGQAVGSPNAVPLFGAQLYCVRREQGRLGELAPLFERVAAESPAFPAYRCGLAEAYLALGRRADARALFEQVMARGLDDLARDKDWPAALGVTAPVCVALGDERRARLLYELFAPLEGRMIAGGHGGVCFGSVSYHRARLAATFGDLEAAFGHFEDAAAELRRAGAPLLLAHAQRDWAQALWKSGAPHEREQARGLAEEAATGYARLGLAWRAEEARTLLRST